MTLSEILPIWNNFNMYIYRKISNRFGFNVNNVLFCELTFSGYNKVVNFIIITPSNTFLIVKLFF